MMFCSKCGKRRMGCTQFFVVDNQPLCESCAETRQGAGMQMIKPIDACSGYLHSAESVALATLVGSPLAGGIIMAINYRRLERIRASRHALVWSVLGTLAVLAAAAGLGGLNAPDEPLRWLVTGQHLVVAGLMWLVAHYLQGPTVEHHVRHGGELASRWLAAGVGLLSSVGLTVVLVVGLLLIV